MTTISHIMKYQDKKERDDTVKKFIITLKEESEILESIITLLESSGIIEVEEVQKSPKKQTHTGIGIIAIDEETGEEVPFESIQQASRVLKISHVDIKSHLDSHESICGYYFKKKHNKPLKFK